MLPYFRLQLLLVVLERLRCGLQHQALGLPFCSALICRVLQRTDRLLPSLRLRLYRRRMRTGLAQCRFELLLLLQEKLAFGGDTALGVVVCRAQLNDLIRQPPHLFYRGRVARGRFRKLGLEHRTAFL